MLRLLFERHHPPVGRALLPIPGANPPRAPSKYADPSQPVAHRLRANLQGSQHVQAHALKFPWRVVVIPTTGKIVFVEVKPPPKSGFPGSGVRRNKYEYFGFWRSACVNSASPSSADIPVSLGPPNVDIFPSTRKKISPTGWIFCLAGFFCRADAWELAFSLRLCILRHGKFRFFLSARQTTTASIRTLL